MAIEAAASIAVALACGCGGTTGVVAPGSDASPGSSSSSGSGLPDAGSSGSVSDSGSAGGQGDAEGAGDDGGQSGSSKQKATKIDLLFDIDNSASMGDKQAYLTQAIPDLVQRLVSPNCVDAAGAVTGTVDATGNCASGAPEFAPVRDMHIGIVSSSLGPRLGNACPTTGTGSTQVLANGTTISRHNDDQAHLLTRGSDPNNLSNYTETPVPDAVAASFLDWAPSGSATSSSPISGGPELQSDLQEMVTGVHQFGCGIESQLESWYRFLVQPDPYASLSVDSSNHAQWTGIDTVLLAQRAEFLRPDSLVAVIVVSDENDSEVDVRSFGGSAWNFMSTSFAPPRGTSACLSSDPATVNSAACTSCAFGNNAADPQCMTDVPSGGTYGVYPATHPEDWGFDLNLRHAHEKQKYGESVQFPIQRYAIGLTSLTVPNRDGEYPPGATSYAGLTAANQTCTNPLFAAQLPAPPAGVDPSQWQPTADALCNLPKGNRGPSLIYYSHIGGVPHQLLQSDPSNPSSPQKTSLSAADWTLILGNDPINYDTTGIDPHMVESYQPRTSATVPINGFPVADSTAPEGTDPLSGREWITDSTSAAHAALLVDLEYACTFKLAAPRDCSNGATAADPTLLDSCDCLPAQSGTGSFTHAEVPALCNDATPTQQDYAKAYPTIREILLARLLGEIDGANEGVVSSLCPIHTVEAMPGDPLYGYRPAMSAIVNRLQASL
jgi:hypothetical protein